MRSVSPSNSPNFYRIPQKNLESEVCAYLASINSCTNHCISIIWVVFSRFRRLRREARRFSASNPGNQHQHQHRNIQQKRHVRTELALNATCTGCIGRHRMPECLNFDEVGMKSVTVSASPLPYREPISGGASPGEEGDLAWLGRLSRPGPRLRG